MAKKKGRRKRNPYILDEVEVSGSESSDEDIGSDADNDLKGFIVPDPKTKKVLQKKKSPVTRSTSSQLSARSVLGSRPSRRKQEVASALESIRTIREEKKQIKTVVQQAKQNVDKLIKDLEALKGEKEILIESVDDDEFNAIDQAVRNAESRKEIPTEIIDSDEMAELDALLSNENISAIQKAKQTLDKIEQKVETPSPPKKQTAIKSTQVPPPRKSKASYVDQALWKQMEKEERQAKEKPKKKVRTKKTKDDLPDFEAVQFNDEEVPYQPNQKKKRSKKGECGPGYVRVTGKRGKKRGKQYCRKEYVKKGRSLRVRLSDEELKQILKDKGDVDQDAVINGTRAQLLRWTLKYRRGWDYVDDEISIKKRK